MPRERGSPPRLPRTFSTSRLFPLFEPFQLNAQHKEQIRSLWRGGFGTRSKAPAPRTITMSRCLVAILLLAKSSSGTPFRPNCTMAPETPNLVLSPNVRGTFDILWSSLFTLLICTWTVQHLNVPHQIFISEKGILEKVTLWISGIWRKIKWMLLTLILPEFLVGKALQGFYRARTSTNTMAQIAIDSGFAWTTTHGRVRSQSEAATKWVESSDSNISQSTVTALGLYGQLQVSQQTSYGLREGDKG